MATVLVHLPVAMIPGLVWLFLLGWRTRRDMPFRKTMLRIFVLGMVVCMPAALLEFYLKLTFFLGGPETFLKTALFFLLVVGPVEEGCKFLILYSEVYRRWHIRTSLDGVLLATASAIGFATYENAVYMAAVGPQVLLLRAWACVLGHVGYSAIFGHYLALAKLRRARPSICMAEGLVLASLLHGLYDIAVTVDERWLYPFVAFEAALYALLRVTDANPLTAKLFPGLSEVESPQGNLALFQPKQFPSLAGQVREEADEAVRLMDRDLASERLEGLRRARSLPDREVHAKVVALTHDAAAEVRELAEEVLQELKAELKRGRR